MGQGDLGLGFIRAPARLAGWTAHRKSSRFHPDHVQVHRGVQFHKVIHHPHGPGKVGLVARRIRHRIGQMVGPGEVDVQTAGDAYRVGQISVPLVARSVAGLRPWLVALVRDLGSPEQFQFGARRIRLELETDTEAHDVAAATWARAAVALSRTQDRPDVVQGTTPPDPITIRPRRRTRGVGQGTRLVGTVPIRGPFPDISVHVEKSPGVRPVGADIRSLADI